MLRRLLAAPLAIFLFACASKPAASPSPQSPAADARPEVIGLDMRDMDPKANPRADFYAFANGGWLTRHPIPEDEPSWAIWNEIQNRTEARLRAIVEEASKGANAPPGSAMRKLGDFYACAMDEKRIEAEGTKPIEPILARIDAIADVEGLRAEIARLRREGLGLLFVLSSDQDFKDATRVIAVISQGGLGLPERDYYVRADEKSVKVREQYVEHVARMLALLGEKPDAAKAHAAGILKLETELATGSLSNVEMRDPNAVYHLLKLADLQALTPRWQWTSYFEGAGVPSPAELNVAQPKFAQKVNELLGVYPVEEWKPYLKWHVVRVLASTLPRAFEEESFRFYGKTLQGVPEQRPRWKRSLGACERALGEALGEAYVSRHFSPEAKRLAREMVANLIAAFRERLKTRPWMSAETRAASVVKLEAITPKIGYPDKWRDYSALVIDRNASFAANTLASRVFEFRRAMAKVGKPVDRTEWGMTPQTVDAYYSPQLNEIVFPAAILQAPFFDERQDDALNYGGMGAVIGHELTHGFDDEGSQFDAKGNLANWWQPKDREEFERRAEKVEKQFSSYVAVDDLKVNGKLTLGENIADLGGLTIAYDALNRALEGNPLPAPLDGFRADQRFFIAYARSWCENVRPESLRMQINVDPHAPARFRAIGPLQNLPPFFAAFGCQPGDPMVRPPEERAEIW